MEVGEKLNSSGNPPPVSQMRGRKPGKFEESKGAKTLVVFTSEKVKVKGGAESDKEKATAKDGDRECEQDLNCSPDMVCLDQRCLPQPGNDLLNTVQEENLVDNTHLVAVEAVEGGDIIKTGKPIEIEEYGSEPNVTTVGNEAVSSQGDSRRGYSGEEIWGREQRKDGSILLAEVQSIGFGREELVKKIRESSSVKEETDVDGKNVKENVDGKYVKENGTEKGESREVEIPKDENEANLEDKKRENEDSLENKKSENGDSLEKKKNQSDLVQELTRSAGGIQLEFEAVPSTLEDRSQREKERAADTDLSKKKENGELERKQLDDERWKEDSAAEVFFSDAQPFKDKTGCRNNCNYLSVQQETETKKEKTMEESSLQMEPLKEDSEDRRSSSGLDSSEERRGCVKDCRNRAHEEGFPEEEETARCPKGMILDVWGYCRWGHHNEVRDWQWWAAIRNYQMAHGGY